MLLKEIEMDLPYKKNERYIRTIQSTEKIGYDKAVQKDYEVNWKEKRKKFRVMTRCMTSMVERLMPRLDTEECWKILVECVDNLEKDKYKNLLGVYTIQVEFNYEYFCCLNSDKKKAYIIDKLSQSINKLNLLVEFSVKELENVCLKIKEKNYINEWLWKKPVKSKNAYAQIKVQHNINEVIIYIVFFDLNMKVLKETPLICTLPDEYAYGRLLGKLQWKKDNEIVLIDQAGSVVGRAIL